MQTETKEGNDKIGFFSSLKFKIMLLTEIFVVIAVTGCIIIAMPASSKLITEQARSSMLSLTKASARTLEYEISNAEGEVPQEMLAGVLADAKLDGVETSYSYLEPRPERSSQTDSGRPEQRRCPKTGRNYI